MIGDRGAGVGTFFLGVGTGFGTGVGTDVTAGGPTSRGVCVCTGSSAGSCTIHSCHHSLFTGAV